MSTNDTITTTSDVPLAGLSFTPGTGNYMVTASVDITAPTDGTDAAVLSIYVGGVQVATTERWVVLPRNTLNSGYTQAYVTDLDSNDVIDVRWRTMNGRSITASNRSLMVMEID